MGAPIAATPKAYKLTNNPALGSETFKSVAIVGIKPTMTNSGNFQLQMH